MLRAAVANKKPVYSPPPRMRPPFFILVLLISSSKYVPTYLYQMGYRPITNVWILARSKVKYFGAYPGGFLSRARAVLGVNHEDRVLHLCAGKVREYPYDGFGPRDVTMDLDPELGPDVIGDANNLADYKRALESYPDVKASLPIRHIRLS
jgi:hypothetical protein